MSQKSTLNANNLKIHYESVATNIFTFDIGLAFKLMYAHVTYTSDATVGNRNLRAAVQNAASQTILDMHTGVNQAASNTNHYVFMQGLYRETSFTGSELRLPLPKELYFPAGAKLVIDDESAVSASDSMVVGLGYLLID